VSAQAAEAPGEGSAVTSQGVRMAARLEELLERPGRMRFPSTLESAFRLHYLEEGLPRLRAGMVVGLLLFGFFGLWDLSSFPPEVYRLSLPLRFGLACPLMGAAWWVTRLSVSPRAMDGLRFAMCMGVSFSVVVITFLARESGLDAQPHGLFLVAVAAYTVTGMRTPQALAAGLAVAVMQLAVDVVSGRPAGSMIEPMIFIASANAIGAVAALGHERSARTSFLRMRLLECHADQDGLTGIPNRRTFDAAVERAFLAAVREKVGLAIALFDVDYFKTYNDRLGHLAGDACLRRIAQAVETLARRPMDVAARIGGEEFAVVWYDTVPEGAERLAHAIRDAVEELAIERPDARTRHRVTVSVGAVHVYPRDPRSTRALAAADEALYEAKDAGRDRSVVRLLD